MKKLLFTFAFFLISVCAVYSQGAPGIYKTDFNELTLTQQGNKITGTYKYRNGRIEGTINGHTLTGMWFQDNGKGIKVGDEGSSSSF